jgi:hypothetical protein
MKPAELLFRSAGRFQNVNHWQRATPWPGYVHLGQVPVPALPRTQQTRTTVNRPLFPSPLAESRLLQLLANTPYLLKRQRLGTCHHCECAACGKPSRIIGEDDISHRAFHYPECPHGNT